MRDESREALPHPLTRPLAANLDIAIVRVTNKTKHPALQLPVEFVEHEVAQQWRKGSPLRSPFHARTDQPVLHHPGIHECPDEFQQPLVLDPFGDRSHPRHLGAEIGFLSILHTWGQNLLAHPHIHCVIPAGGISRDRTRWVQPRYPFFLPVKVLSRVFRGKFVSGLQRAFLRGKLGFYGVPKALRDPKLFRALVRSLFRQDWFVYAKPPFGGPEYVLHYLARYTHRVAISNHRLVAFQDGKVTFCWKDYAHGNQKLKMILTADEFLRRFLLHVLPKGFVRIRFSGFLANRRRKKLLPLAQQLLKALESAGWRVRCLAP